MKANWKGIELDARAKKPLSMQEAMGEVLKAREAEKEECRAGRGASPFRSKADPRLDIPDKVGIGLGRGSERTAKRILELLVDGPMRPSALREAVGMACVEASS